MLPQSAEMKKEKSWKTNNEEKYAARQLSLINVEHQDYDLYKCIKSHGIISDVREYAVQL